MPNTDTSAARSKRARAALGLALAGVALVTLSSWPQPAGRVQALVNCDTLTAAMDADETLVVTLMNAERAAAGLGPLKVSSSLARAAAWKSEDPSALPPLSHTDSLGRDTVKPAPNNRAMACGYPTWAGENIAAGFGSPQSVVTAWMGSSLHRANILKSNYVVTGVGKAGGAWTVTFGVLDDSGNATPPPTALATATKTATRTATGAATSTKTATMTSTPAATRTPTSVPTATPTPQPLIAEVDLQAGFNLTAYAGPQRAPAQAFASLSGSLTAAYLWDTASQRWYRYMPGAPAYASNLDAVRPGEAYFLDLSAPDTWAY